MKAPAIPIRFVLALLIAFISLRTFGSPSAPVGLLVNGVSNPLAVDRDDIRFTWMSKNSTRGETQTAYQILVVSSAEQLADWNSDCWDSGKVNSGQSASIEYRGKALPVAARFWWKVR
ncbi:MAG: family 78 glycoside hydrolase catalytic domain, partial [Limisphaerales bacterium]